MDSKDKEIVISSLNQKRVYPDRIEETNYSEINRNEDRVLKQAGGSNITLRTIARGEAIRAGMPEFRTDRRYDKTALKNPWVQNHSLGAYWTAALKYMNDHNEKFLALGDGRVHSRYEVARNAVSYANAAIEGLARSNNERRARGIGNVEQIKVSARREKAVVAEQQAVNNYKSVLLKQAAGNPDKMAALTKKEIASSKGIPPSTLFSKTYPVNCEKDGIGGNIRQAACWTAILHRMNVKGESARDIGGKTYTRNDVARAAMNRANAAVAVDLQQKLNIRHATHGPSQGTSQTQNRVAHKEPVHEGLGALLNSGLQKIGGIAKTAATGAVIGPVPSIIESVSEKATALFNQNISQGSDEQVSRGISR